MGSQWPSKYPDFSTQNRARPFPYRQRPADAGEHAVETEEVDQVKGEDHYEVANGDHFEVSVGTEAGPRSASHTDEGNQQHDPDTNTSSMEHQCKIRFIRGTS